MKGCCLSSMLFFSHRLILSSLRCQLCVYADDVIVLINNHGFFIRSLCPHEPKMDKPSAFYKELGLGRVGGETTLQPFGILAADGACGEEVLEWEFDIW